MIVSNATPLIYLAKTGKLGLLKKLFNKIYISEEVKTEAIDKGKLIGKKDAYVIEQAMKSGWIIVKKAGPMKIPIPLHEGESPVIRLASQMKAGIVLLDEAQARTAAKLMGLKPLGTAGVILMALKKKEITYEEFLLILESLTKEGFRLGNDVYTDIISNAEKFR